MREPLISVPLERDHDLVLCRQRAGQLTELLGLDRMDQTRVATAVSEIARNALTYAGSGTAGFALERAEDEVWLCVTVSDEGPGIVDLDRVLSGTYRSTTGMGLGMVGSRRLMDRFAVETAQGVGTRVTMMKRVPPRTTAPVTSAQVAMALLRDQPLAPSEEVRRQNRELLEVLATLCSRNEEVERLNQELSETNRGIVALYSELEAGAEALTHQALHDPLTALPNRALLLDRLGQALRRSDRRPGTVAALFLDLDRFKVVNDSLGHDAGDELLVAVAQRLRAVVRPGDTVARLGGDEFVVLCEDVADVGGAIALSERIEAAVAIPVVIGPHKTEVVVSASVGIAIPSDSHVHPYDLLRDADTAMYRAKQRGGGSGHQVFDDSFRVEAVGRLKVETALRHAVDNDQMRVHYQPIVDLATGGIVGAEALVRYEDPARGLVGPAEFLSVAEESGLIVPLGAWVLAEACRQARRWQHPDRAPFEVSVNLSARQLTLDSFVQVLKDTLVQHELPPGALSLEITESALMDAALSNPNLLEGLKAVGPRLGLDDFGTGYSSLTYLRRFPLEFIKVDRSFVHGLGRDAGDTAIVEAVIALGTALGLMTVAEGVETAEHLALLRALGCNRAQGYYFARPLPGHDLTELLAAQPRW